jgi:hypothetical protein
VSMAYTVCVKEVPTRHSWQQYLDLDAIPLKLIESIEVDKYCGFVPMELAGNESGVEIYIDDYDEVHLPAARDTIGDRTKMITFSFGGDAGALCCASAAAATLAKHTNGIAFFDGEPQTYEQIMAEYTGMLSDAMAETDPTKHRDLLAALEKALPNYLFAKNVMLYRPLGDCARGLNIYPRPRYENFGVSFLASPWYVPHKRFHFCPIPAHLNIVASHYEIRYQSTNRAYWNYNSDAAVDELVEMVRTKLDSHFQALANPIFLATSLYDQCTQYSDIYELEMAGMACAAAGKHDKALELFDRIKKQSDPTRRYDYIVAIEDRCEKIGAFIKANRLKEMADQFAEWKGESLQEFGLTGSE